MHIRVTEISFRFLSRQILLVVIMKSSSVDEKQNLRNSAFKQSQSFWHYGNSIFFMVQKITSWNIILNIVCNFLDQENVYAGICWGISPPATCWKGGGGVKRPHVITRERMAAERRPKRRSKALDETILKRPLNFPNEVTCQVKVRSKVKIGAFRLRAVETSKLPVLGQNLLRVLLKYRARHWLSKCLILSPVQGQDQVTKGHHT